MTFHFVHPISDECITEGYFISTMAELGGEVRATLCCIVYSVRPRDVSHNVLTNIFYCGTKNNFEYIIST